MTDKPVLTSAILKDALLEELHDRVVNGEVDKDGNPCRAAASTLAVAAGFLKQFPPAEDLPKATELSNTLAAYGDKIRKFPR